MEDCPFYLAGLCDGEHPIEKIPGFDSIACIALRTLWTRAQRYPAPEGADQVKVIPEHFACKDGSTV